MQYTASTRGYRKFDLMDDMGIIVGRLGYPSAFSSAAHIIVNERQVYDIKLKGFWGTRRQILKSDMPFGEILANMRGTVEIYFQTGKMLYFRRRSVWRNEFILTDGTRQVIAQLQGKFHWAKLGFDYEIDVYDNRLDREINTLIPFLMTYSAMYLKRRTAAAG